MPINLGASLTHKTTPPASAFPGLHVHVYTSMDEQVMYTWNVFTGVGCCSGDLSIPADCLNISLGKGLSVTLKAGRECSACCGSCGSVVGAPAAKA